MQLIHCIQINFSANFRELSRFWPLERNLGVFSGWGFYTSGTSGYHFGTSGAAAGNLRGR